ncbi:2-C-methyl-D-erythritol 4-phosphate cytidylyltransferase [Sulfurifustis variabilis]|uniref:2-C-methyl-D-erythritol 4-phosphate cytidylyltransferase n=1 Tax=Sulfurifustis variabilis TaxID=1675686 RepID=A0A1B4V4X0_9GAMM|nr:2-C-methyl-D-erythritol 4-phosphate cytidylyltransferase [Sulfurifustis variabilis]BAU48579.1 2-C-methyl-D-erythritol 4-phosphate cytidylyltransferase [Sulfurifustis variabilis]
MSAATGIWGLVPAAGTGTRMKAALPKQYLPLLGRPVILHTLERLCGYARLQGVLVGISRDDVHWEKMRPVIFPRLMGTSEGGATRAATVLNALIVLAKTAREDDWVLVHDAVRPCIRHSDLDKLIDAVSADGEGGLLAMPLTDTVKRADAEGRVIETVPRQNLWRALTPQMFRLGSLRDALKRALADGVEVTDEAAAMERVGARPKVIEGRADNIKITLPADLVLAELYLKQQGPAP